jgi:hypothetical protein
MGGEGNGVVVEAVEVVEVAGAEAEQVLIPIEQWVGEVILVPVIVTNGCVP